MSLVCDWLDFIIAILCLVLALNCRVFRWTLQHPGKKSFLWDYSPCWSFNCLSAPLASNSSFSHLRKKFSLLILQVSIKKNKEVNFFPASVSKKERRKQDSFIWHSSFLFKRFIYIYECLPACIYVHHEHVASAGSGVGVRFPRTWIKDGCKLPCVCSEPNPDTL